jgi:hypothetical protein
VVGSGVAGVTAGVGWGVTGAAVVGVGVAGTSVGGGKVGSTGDAVVGSGVAGVTPAGVGLVVTGVGVVGLGVAGTFGCDPAGPSEILGEGSILGMIGDGVMIGAAGGRPKRPVTM